MRSEEFGAGSEEDDSSVSPSVSLVCGQHPEDSLLKHHDEAQLIDMRAAMAAAGAILEVSQREQRRTTSFSFTQNAELISHS